MSRSGYVDDCDGDDPTYLLWPSIVRRALKGKRGQAFLREMRSALDAMPQKRLIAEELQDADGEVCAMGCVGRARGIDMSKLDPEDAEAVAKTFGIAPVMAREIAFVNDDDFSWKHITPEERWAEVSKWVDQQLNESA